MKLKQNILQLLFGLLTLVGLFSCSSGKTPEFTRSIVWQNGEIEVEGYRIPGITVSTKGTVLAFSEARVNYHDHTPNHIVLKRSTDGGINWSPSIFIEESNGSYWAANKDQIDPLDDPEKKEVWTNIAPIVDQTTGRIFFFYALNEGEIAGMNLQRYTRVFYKYSDDDGISWSDRKEITPLLHVKRDGTPNTDDAGNFLRDINGFPCDYLGRAFHMPGPGHGIRLNSGRLLLQIWNRTALGKIGENGKAVPIPIEERQYGVSTIYSDDHGETWHYGSSFGEEIHFNESRIVELDNGDVYMNARYTIPGGTAHRATAISRDGGKSWTDEKIDTNFPLTNQCDGGLNKITDPKTGKTYLLYSKNESPEGRKNLTIRVSEDNGKTWPVTKVLDPGAVSYSDIAVLPDNTILILYETGKGKPVYCIRTNIEWIKDKSDQPIHWMDCATGMIPELPVKSGLGGAFAGIHNDVLIVAGGSYFNTPLWENGEKIYTDSIFVCTKEGNTMKWSFAGRLPYPIAHGASVSTSRGLVCIGGKTDENDFNNVWLLQWDASAKKVIVDTSLPQLPTACIYPSATFLDNHLFVAGNAFENLLKLEFRPGKETQWQIQGKLPGKPRQGAILIKQSNGENDCLYYMGGKNGSEYLTDAYCYNYKSANPASSEWIQLSDLPRPVFGSPSIAYSTSNIFLFSGSDGHDIDRIHQIKDNYQFTTDILSFNTITKEWSSVGTMPQGVVNTPAVQWNGQIAIPGGEVKPSVRTSQVFSASAKAEEKGVFSVLDYATLIVYLLLIVWLGYYFSKKNKSSKDFFLGGQKIPFWAAGLSMMAAQVSSIGFMSIPAKSFITNWSYFAGVMTWFIVVPVVIYAFVPFYRRLNVTSAYEYLEKRFNVFIRKFIALLYLLFQLLGRLGAIIFLPAIALSAVTGIDTLICIIIIGGLATLYTVLGGMHAVIWIDVIQALVLFGAIFLCIGYIIFSIDGGVTEIFTVAAADNKFSFGRMDWDMTAAVFWVIVIGNIFNRIGSMATDQSVVQRYLTTKDEKETAKALWTDALVSIPWALCVFGLGTALYVFYKVNPDMLNPSISNDEVVPFFIGQNLPVGLSGIVIAGIFAASMSSVDSSIHSSTTVIMRDFMKGILSRISEEQNVKLARIITTIIGILGTGIAVVMTFFDINSVWDIILEFAGLFTGAMTGVFILGIFSTRANGKGAAIGAIASAALLLYVKTFTPLNFFLYSGIGIISCVIIGYLASFMFKSTKSTEGLTIYSVGLKKDSKKK